MPKKKVFASRNLKDCLPSLPLKSRKAKKKIKVFLSRQFYASLKRVRTLEELLSIFFLEEVLSIFPHIYLLY